MKLRAIRRRAIRRMGPVQAVTMRRLQRAMTVVFVDAFEAASNQSRILVQGVKRVMLDEMRRLVLRPMIRDIVQSIAPIAN
jgi:hypothetical protein